jgi:hypothetical protein
MNTLRFGAGSAGTVIATLLLLVLQLQLDSVALVA